MKLDVEDLLNYHCPRWNELPEIDLYIDQVTYILQNNLSIFAKDKETPIITSSMINNYVKQDILQPPIKKKYNRQHLSYLFVICILKRLMSISEIGNAIVTMKKIVTVEEGYNMFCEELEKAIKRTFNPELESKITVKETDVREYIILKAMVTAFANCVLVDRLILLRKEVGNNVF